MAYLESIVNRRQPGEPRTAGLPAPAPAAPSAPNQPGVATAPPGRPGASPSPAPSVLPARPGGVGGTQAQAVSSSPAPGLPPTPPGRGLPPAPPQPAQPVDARPSLPQAPQPRQPVEQPKPAPPQSPQPAQPTDQRPSLPSGPQPPQQPTYYTQLDRAPRPVDFVGQPPGASILTPYGTATRDASGKITYTFNAGGEQKYKEAVAAKRQRFGPLPANLAAIPNLPQPPVTLEGRGYNPFQDSFFD